MRDYIARQVPGYMVLAYIHVPAMPSPLTASDKLSRRQIMDHATRIAE